MIQRAAPVSDAIQHRLFGSPNRIEWSADDLSAIIRRIEGGPADRLQALTLAREQQATVALSSSQNTIDESRTFLSTISTGAVDRMGDDVDPAGWKIPRDVPVLWSHDAAMPPVGRAVSIWSQNGKLRAKAELASSDLSAFAERVRKMIGSGFLRAISVGFRPLKWKFVDDKSRPYGISFIEQELLEFSVVNVPACPEALIDPGQFGGASSGAKAALRLRRQRELELIMLRSGHWRG